MTAQLRVSWHIIVSVVLLSVAMLGFSAYQQESTVEQHELMRAEIATLHDLLSEKEERYQIMKAAAATAEAARVDEGQINVTDAALEGLDTPERTAPLETEQPQQSPLGAGDSPKQSASSETELPQNSKGEDHPSKAPPPPRTFSVEEARECLNGSSLWFMGNSVSRHLFVAMAHFLETGQKASCDSGYRQREQESCPQELTCQRTVPSHNIRLDFKWQQRIHDQTVEDLFDRATVDGGMRQIVISNAGLDDIVVNAHSETQGGRNPNRVWQPGMTSWRESCRVQVPRLKGALEAWFMKAPFARLVWRTTTAVCGVDNWTLEKDEANSQIAYSNEMIRGALESLKYNLVHGSDLTKRILPRMQAYLAQKVSSSSESGLHGGSQVEWTDHSASHALQVLDMFESTRLRCDAYDDHVHHCTLGDEHVQRLLRQLCPVKLRLGYPPEWPQEFLRRHVEGAAMLNRHLQQAEPARGGCRDTPDWVNDPSPPQGLQRGCVDYAREGWCAGGGVIQAWAAGGSYGYPERNCCVCGKAAVVRG